MTLSISLDVRTASPEQSIWRELPEDSFRQRLVDLEERTNAVPLDPQVFPIHEWSPDTAGDGEGTYTLSLAVEQQLANDFAFLAAIGEGAQSVSAACLEEHVQPQKLTVRLAAVDISVEETLQLALQDVSNILIEAASHRRVKDAGSASYDIELLFRRVVHFHRGRIVARLRSVKWEKPRYLSRSHKKPLWQDFSNLIHRAQFLYTKAEAQARRSLESGLHELASIYEGFEIVPSDPASELAYISQLVQASFVFCTSEQGRSYSQRLEDLTTGPNAKLTKQVASAIKCFRQIEKIAAYWRISRSLVGAARRYPSLFQPGIELAFLTPFKSVPTTVGYESWAQTCHVHAEIQLIVWYDLGAPHDPVHQTETRTTVLGSRRTESPFHLPRVMGSSKYFCYLCYLFIRTHGRFFPANTHGRLYDQWTVPDLSVYSDSLRQRYRDILQSINDEIVTQLDNFKGTESDKPVPLRWRAEPMTSRQNLLLSDLDVVEIE